MSGLGGLLASVVGGAAGLAAGGCVGLALGRRYGDVAWRFWVIGVAVLVVCSVLCAAGIGFGLRWVSVGALGLLAGALTGLKYGARGGFLPLERG